MSLIGALESSASSMESKHYNMKQFIATVREYNRNKADDTANLLNRHLQLLSVTLDTSIFDPHTSVAAEFFVSLYELLSNVEQRSTLTWCCVNVLSIACRNPSARTALIHTYQFLPPLARLLGNHLSTEKRLKLLGLMQELTCGVKISWQIPHLPHLMATLTKWVESEDEEVVALSLGVLVNLCYKNLPAVYTLSRCVDLKKFVRTCMPLKGLKIEVHVCKLLIILDCLNGKIPENVFMKLTEVTFKSLIEAFRARDTILLRHIVEFFLDVREHNNHIGSVANFKDYDVEVVKILEAIKESDNETGDQPTVDPESMSLAFEFLHCLIEQDLPKLHPLYPEIVAIAQKWIQTEIACSQSLAVLRTIAQTSPIQHAILAPFIDSVKVLLLTLNAQDEMPTHTEYNKRISALMQLLRALIDNADIRRKILETLTDRSILKVFAPLLGDEMEVGGGRASNADIYSSEAINLYVNALVLVNELAKQEMDWVGLYGTLIRQKPVHMVLAQALYSGAKETKHLVLGLTGAPMFPTQEMASTLCDLQLLVQNGKNHTSASSTSGYEFNFPIMSIAQLERLDEVMNLLKESCRQNNFLGVSTSDVMELYEYKLASMGHAERAATASVEAASEKCTHLQHRLAQLTAELARLHQLLFHSQKCHEEAARARDHLVELNRELSNKLEAERGRVKALNSQLGIKETDLAEREHALEEVAKKLKETSATKAILEEQNTDFKRIVSKLEENLLRKEKVVEKKEEQVTRLTASCDHMKAQQQQLEKQLLHTEAALSARESELAETSKDLENCRSIIGTITKLTHSQYAK